jgi:hypothetical protein
MISSTTGRFRSSALAERSKSELEERGGMMTLPGLSARLALSLYETSLIPEQEMSHARSGDGSIFRSKPKTQP